MDHDVVVIGGGQAGMAVSYYLRRTALRWTVLDAQEEAGGAWRHAWPSLRLFSPAQWSSLPGWPMPRGADVYPTRDGAVAYLAAYERRYAADRVERPVRVHAVHRDSGALLVETSAGARRARAVVSATGTWERPLLPLLPGQHAYEGTLLHSSRYAGPAPFAGRRVVVVGAGNSAAQILADLSRVARTTWAVREPPRFLPDDVDGRTLFAQASARWAALREGRDPGPARGLGDIVMVASVREARDRGVLRPVPIFSRFTRDGVVWPDGTSTREDAVIWATGFRPALAHLDALGVREPGGRIPVRGTRSTREPRLWLVGYGDWTGFASATLIGVGRWARATVGEIEGELAAAA